MFKTRPKIIFVKRSLKYQQRYTSTPLTVLLVTPTPGPTASMSSYDPCPTPIFPHLRRCHPQGFQRNDTPFRFIEGWPALSLKLFNSAIHPPTSSFLSNMSEPASRPSPNTPRTSRNGSAGYPPPDHRPPLQDPFAERDGMDWEQRDGRLYHRGRELEVEVPPVV